MARACMERISTWMHVCMRHIAIPAHTRHRPIAFSAAMAATDEPTATEPARAASASPSLAPANASMHLGTVATSDRDAATTSTSRAAATLYHVRRQRCALDRDALSAAGLASAPAKPGALAASAAASAAAKAPHSPPPSSATPQQSTAPSP